MIRYCTVLALLIVVGSCPVLAADDGASLAFARFVSHTDTPPVDNYAIEIEASLPQMGKKGRFEAIRHRGATGAPEYELVKSEGDSTVKQQIIARYLTVEQQAYTRPAASLAFTPENYRFHYLASTESGPNRFYIFAVKPRHGGAGLIKGHIWIDGATGAVVHQEGRVAKGGSMFIRRIGIVRDAAPHVSSPYVLVTRIDIETRLFGRAELTIRERPALSNANQEVGQ